MGKEGENEAAWECICFGTQPPPFSVSSAPGGNSIDSPLSVALFVLAHLRSESPYNHILQSKWHTHFTLIRDVQFPSYFKIYVNLVLKAVKNPGRSQSRRNVNKGSGSGPSHKDRQITQDSCFNTHFPTASLLAPMDWGGMGGAESWFNYLSQIRSQTSCLHT